MWCVVCGRVRYCQKAAYVREGVNVGKRTTTGSRESGQGRTGRCEWGVECVHTGCRPTLHPANYYYYLPPTTTPPHSTRHTQPHINIPTLSTQTPPPRLHPAPHLTSHHLAPPHIVSLHTTSLHPTPSHYASHLHPPHFGSPHALARRPSTAAMPAAWLVCGLLVARLGTSRSWIQLHARRWRWVAVGVRV